MQQTSPVGNDPATGTDSGTVETTGSTPTTAPEATRIPDQAGPGPEASTPVASGPGAPPPGVPHSQQFPPTLVGLDPPTLPASDGLKPPHRDVDARGPADLPQFRPFPHPQRSEPGHPRLRHAWKRMLTFWRRTTI